MAEKSAAGGAESDLPPGRKALAHAIAVLYENLAVRTLVEAAELLASRNWRKDPSEISRYRSGRRKPPIEFVLLLRELAVDRSGPDEVAYSPAELRELHTSAEATLCRSCGRVRREVERLRGENSRLLAHKAQAGSLPPATSRAGNPARPASRAPLPVPLSVGDRQRRARDVAAAQQLAASAIRLRGRGLTGYAVALIHDTSASLTPLESAAAIALLRDGQNDLADTAISVNGQVRVEEDVMRIAVELHELGLPDDAGAILRAALGQTPTPT